MTQGDMYLAGESRHEFIGQQREDPEAIRRCLTCTLPMKMCEGLGNPEACRAAYETGRHPIGRKEGTCEWRLLRVDDEGSSVLRDVMREKSVSVPTLRNATGIPYGTLQGMAFSSTNKNKEERVELNRARRIAEFLEVPLGLLVETREGDEDDEG